MKTTCNQCVFATYGIRSDETKSQNGCRFNRLDKFEKNLVYDHVTHKESYELLGFCNSCRQIDVNLEKDISIERAIEIVSEEIKPKIDIVITDDFEDLSTINSIIEKIPQDIYNKIIIARKSIAEDLSDLCLNKVTCTYHVGESLYEYQYLDEAVRHSTGDYLLFISSEEVPNLNSLYATVNDLVNNKMANFAMIHNLSTIHGCLLVKSIYSIVGTFANNSLINLIQNGDFENKGIITWEQLN